MPPKRLSRFTEKLQNEFTFLKKVHSDNDYDVFCTICSSPFSVSHGGRSDITDHLKTKKHKTAKNAASFSSVRTFFNNLKADDTSLKLAAKELTFVYHTISHNQSFNSMNCTSSLIRTLFNEKQFTAARTKSRDIAVNVLAPFVVKITKIDLEKANFVSILVDASNHKYMKFVPVIVRYFSSTLGVQNKILEFSNLPGETAEIIHAHIVKVLNENALSDKIISFSADNTNTNFGGMLRKGKNNVFLKLKQTLNRNILGMGCCAHIIHNSIQYASDCLPVDVDSIVCKIFGFFHIYTVRVENLKEFCDDVDVQYKDLLSHSKTRWLSLFPAIERIISMFDGLKSYFLSQSNCPCILKNFFEDECSLLWFKFLHSQLKTFNNYIKKVESRYYFLLLFQFMLCFV